MSRQDLSKFDYLTIEEPRGQTYHHPGRVAVYGHGEYGRGSVLEGQPMRVWLGEFDNVEAAKKEYPTAEESGCTHIDVNVLTAHLPDDDGVDENEANDYRNE